MSNGWIAVDLDGTLAHYEGWVSEEYIGEPILPMVERVKAWLAEGKDVRVFTARVCANSDRDVEQTRQVIEAWCLAHVGQVLPVTNVKDYGMVVLYDDRCVQVVANTGELVEIRETPLLSCIDCKNTESPAGAMARQFNHGRCLHCGGYFKVVRA